MRPYSVPAHVRKRRAQRWNKLSALGFESYGDYLRSPHWQATKARYRASELPQDCICGEEDVHLHHMTYERVGMEKLGDLTPLCRNCHALVHVLEFRGEIGLDLEGFQDKDRALASRELLRAAADQRESERLRNLAAEQAEVLNLSLASRLMKVVDRAKLRRVDVSHQIFVIRKASERRNEQYIHRRLVLLEEQIYGWAGWAMRCINEVRESEAA